jgi:hypothetical protein
MPRSVERMEDLATATVPPRTESDLLRERAEELDMEAGQLADLAKLRRGEAATLRARADRMDDPERGVKVVTARKRVRRDGLMAAAGVAVESLSSGFSARDLAAALGIADVGRATRLLSALADFGKVVPLGEGWLAVDPDETAVRDYARERGEFTLGGLIVDAELTEADATAYVHRLLERGVIEGEAGHYRYVQTPGDSSPRPRRRPPEKDPPAGTEAPKRGEAVRIVDHGKRATATARHREKLRDQRHARMQEAREQSAQRRRERERNVMGKRKKKK